MTATAYIALGANLGDRLVTLRQAVERLKALGEVTALSSVYETEPWGFADQPAYLNMVAAVQTDLLPIDLMRALLDIERDLGRVRTFANAPRTLDLDLLLVGDQRIETDVLTLPHPRMGERAFVLVPLAEIAPQVVDPMSGRTMRELRDALGSVSGIEMVAAPFAQDAGH